MTTVAIRALNQVALVLLIKGSMTAKPSFEHMATITSKIKYFHAEILCKPLRFIMRVHGLQMIHQSPGQNINALLTDTKMMNARIGNGPSPLL